MGAETEATSESLDAPRRFDLHPTESSGSYELVLGAVIFGLFGLLIDRWLGTTPLFILTFTIAGFAGAAISIYYRYKHRIAQLQEESAALRSAAERDTTAGPLR